MRIDQPLFTGRREAQSSMQGSPATPSPGKATTAASTKGPSRMQECMSTHPVMHTNIVDTKAELKPHTHVCVPRSQVLTKAELRLLSQTNLAIHWGKKVDAQESDRSYK